MEGTLKGRLRKIPGQSIFCLNVKTGEISDLGQPKRIDIQEGCIYRQCLNKKNFIRKLIKEGIIKPELIKEKTMICKKCGAENSDMRKCCMKCGSFLEGWTVNNITRQYGYRGADGFFYKSEDDYRAKSSVVNPNSLDEFSLREHLNKMELEMKKIEIPIPVGYLRHEPTETTIQKLCIWKQVNTGSSASSVLALMVGRK